MSNILGIDIGQNTAKNICENKKPQDKPGVKQSKNSLDKLYDIPEMIS